MASKKKGGLGRGLEALFADAAPIYEEEKEEIRQDEKRNSTIAETAIEEDKENPLNQVVYVNINEIRPNVAQPRQTFDEGKLKELANSISRNGIIQPVVIRTVKGKRGYELVAGERRWRAARIAGLKKIPGIIRDIDDKQNVVFAVLENMQREDLNPIEEAAGINQMINSFDFTQLEASEMLGKSRTYITNSLRLLKLPEKIQECIVNGDISAAHGRTLINIENSKKQLELCEKIIKEGLSVRAIEKIASGEKQDKKKNRKIDKKKNKSIEIIAVEEELIEAMGTKVTINGSSKRGKLEIEYYSTEELNRIIEMLRQIPVR